MRQKQTNWGLMIAAGALAGLAASVPMGLAMIGLNRALTRRAPEPEPPKRITAKMAKRAGMQAAVRPGMQWGPATWLGHLGYGAATASLYPLVTRRLPLPEIGRGMVFALGIWAGSYLGWLPALNVLPSAIHQPARRNAVMISSHLLWGGLIGLIVKLFQERTDPSYREIRL
jgi:uncharacterized membrane protein YagU involved in acid resistance